MASRLIFVVALVGFVSYASAQCNPACMNGGKCMPVDGLVNENYCQCAEGWMGPTCMARYESCPSGDLVCYNGGKCVPDSSSPDAWRCQCPATWTDPSCKTALTTCNTTGLVCMNGGTCTDDALGPYCACPPNIRGRQCEFGVVECKDGMYCMNQGKCTSDGKSCQCTPEYFGLHCQNSVRDPNAARIDSAGLPGWAVAVIVIGVVLAVGLASLAGFLIFRERKGKPVFAKYGDDVSGMQAPI